MKSDHPRENRSGEDEDRKQDRIELKESKGGM
jgi:hypothetical protein